MFCFFPLHVTILNFTEERGRVHITRGDIIMTYLLAQKDNQTRRPKQVSAESEGSTKVISFYLWSFCIRA